MTNLLKQEEQSNHCLSSVVKCKKTKKEACVEKASQETIIKKNKKSKMWDFPLKKKKRKMKGETKISH